MKKITDYIFNNGTTALFQTGLNASFMNNGVTREIERGYFLSTVERIADMNFEETKAFLVNEAKDLNIKYKY